MNDKLPFKILLIHQNEIVPYDFIPHTEVGYNHALSYVQYLQNHYLDDSELQKMTVRTNPNTIGIALVDRGNIVILDTTSYRTDVLEKYGKSLLFMFPKEIDEQQISIMQELLPLYENANEYSIWYDFLKVDGETKCQCSMGKDVNIITHFIETYTNNKKK